VNESDEHDVQFIESGENSAKSFEVTEQAFDFIKFKNNPDTLGPVNNQ
jgi:hypothetical protein